MQVNEMWLREWVQADVPLETLVEQLTMAGLEVDALTASQPEFSGVIVGEVVSVEPHPNAYKLRVCEVSDGAGLYQVVCGAPNVAPGMKAPYARVGAELPGGLRIEAACLRGVDSAGMLCGGSELGLTEDDGGLMVLPESAPAGTALEVLLALDDHVLELDITPNRGDCFSVLGLAREVAVINQAPLRDAAVKPIAHRVEDAVEVSVSAPEHCPRYCARVLKAVDVSRPTPLWMQERLRRVGLRSIDPVVDVTNYILMELGQPMHAFDLATIDGGIEVRLAGEGESLTLLDGQTLSLEADTLVIADAQRARAVAGIMGGQDSGVSAGTRDILLESAFFSPDLLAGKARRYGLHTDSSHRFERGVDFSGQRRAIERATALLVEITGAEPGPIVEVASEEHLPRLEPILLRGDRIRRVLGLQLSEQVVEEMLGRLGFAVEAQAEASWKLTPPPWRFDMAIEADILEELARIYGYNRLPATALEVPLQLKSKPETGVEKSLMRQQLIARAYQEAITYSFIAPELQQLFASEPGSVTLANPISAEMSEMRQSLWPGLVSTVAYNLNRQQNRVRLFETGLSFVERGGEIVQSPMLAAAVCGTRWAESWGLGADTVDFFDLKGDLEAVLALTGRLPDLRVEAALHPALHDGQSARVYLGQQAIGWIGRLHPRVQAAMDLSQPVYLFELALEAVSEASLPAFSELSKFPEVRRDIAVLVDESLPASSVMDLIRSEAGEHLTGLSLFDVYRGKGIEKQGKSLALGLTFRDQYRTLNDSDINGLIDRIVDALARQFGASLRN